MSSLVRDQIPPPPPPLPPRPPPPPPPPGDGGTPIIPGRGGGGGGGGAAPEVIFRGPQLKPGGPLAPGDVHDSGNEDLIVRP